MAVSEEQKELWIDLHALISSSCSSCLDCECHEKNTCPDGKPSYLVIYYHYSKKNPEELYSPTLHLLRKALRAVGHKITKRDCYLCGDLSPYMIVYRTSITEKEYRENDYWNEWVGNITTEHYGYNHDDDSDSDNDSDSDTEEEEEEQELENPT